MFKKLAISLCFVGIMLVLASNQVITSYLNHHASNYEYQLPEQTLVIHLEPKSQQTIFPALRNIIAAAFSDYNLEIDITNTKQPHLILRYAMSKQEARDLNRNTKFHAPYITVSGEKYPIRANRFRNNGLPFAEVVSFKPESDKQIYLPFIAWDNILPEREFDHKERHFVAYVASNCVKHREELFRHLNSHNTAHALGICSNPFPKRIAGDWRSLPEVYADYQFVMAMENGIKPGYVTEKIAKAFIAGSIPIYYGDTKTLTDELNINPKAYIDVSNFDSMLEAANYIKALSQNQHELAKIMAEPVFINNQVPELLMMGDDPHNRLVQQAAKKLRALYDLEINRHANSFNYQGSIN